MITQAPDPSDACAKGKPIGPLIAAGAGCLLLTFFLLGNILLDGICCGVHVFDLTSDNPSST